MTKLVALIASFAAAYLPVGAHAATITKSDSELCVLKLEGRIESGDFEHFMELADTEFKGFDGESSSNDTICLDSPGGNVNEGLKLAKQFFKQGVGTVVPAGAECYSTCAILFMMGIAKGPEVNFANRKLHVTGTLGFHRPGADELLVTKAQPADLDLAMESMMEIMMLANNLVPWSAVSMMRPDLIQEMLTHVGDDFFLIDTVEKAGRFQIEAIGYEMPTTLTKEQAYYACENMFHWQVGLIGKDTDYLSMILMGSGYRPAEISKVVQSTADRTIYSVISGDDGYSEAGCLIGRKNDYFYGCGYNGMYDVSFGFSQCTVDDFDFRSHGLPTLALFKPSTPIRELANWRAQTPDTQFERTGICLVFTPSDSIIDQEPCEIRPRSEVSASGKQIAGYDFVWPSGSKTILLNDGKFLTINGKLASGTSDAAYNICAINQETRNRFCYKHGS